MDACPSLPLKILTTAGLRLPAKHTPRMAAIGCRFAVCCLVVQFVNIGMFPSRCAIHMITQASLYKVGPAILSRTFYKKNKFSNFNCIASITLVMFELSIE
jgi:hypothetical protein